MRNISGNSACKVIMFTKFYCSPSKTRKVVVHSSIQWHITLPDVNPAKPTTCIVHLHLRTSMCTKFHSNSSNLTEAVTSKTPLQPSTKVLVQEQVAL